MGLLVDGQWVDRWYETASTGGRFVRKPPQFRAVVGAETDFSAARDRYHLYVSYACPWAHRTLIMRALKQLQPVISVSVVNWLMGSEGWTFDPGPGVIADTVLGATRLHQVYTAAQATYTGRVTVPVLWDRQLSTIVNNESSEIIRIFNRAFNDYTSIRCDFYPPALRPEIDRLNALVYDHVNNGVYKCGFATTQTAYADAFAALFDTLNQLERLLGERDFLAGAAFTEADIRLFTTLIRFDAVYHGHFKCNLRRLVDYPHLHAHTRMVYQLPGVADTVRWDHIKGHYYQSHRSINPSGVVPLGPALDFTTAHHRPVPSVV